MAIKDWNGFKKSGDTYIPNDATARAGSVTLLDDTTGWVSKNSLQYPYFDKGDKTSNTITFIDNGNGEITVKAGTATGGNAQYYIVGDGINTYGDVSELVGKTVCGNPTVYDVSHVDLRIWFYDTNKTYISAYHVSNIGAEISIPTGAVYYVMVIRIDQNTTVANDVLISPMICDPSVYALSPSYEPYHKSVEEYAFPRSEQAVVGVKNLWPKYTGSSATPQNVTFTADSDGVVSCEGTSSAIATWRQGNLTLKAGKYKLYGGEGIGTYNSSSYNALVGLYNPSSSAYFAPDEGTVDTYTFATDIVVQPTLKIQTGVDSSNYTFKPMIYFADDPDSTFVPNVMTNRELTEKVQGIINAATNAADFAAFKTAISNL